MKMPISAEAPISPSQNSDMSRSAVTAPMTVPTMPRM